MIEIDEIINSGIGSEDTILHLGAGYKDGLLLETLCNYWGIDSNDFLSNQYYIGVDGNPEISNKLSLKFDTDSFITDSFQNYLDSNTSQMSDWTILTGVFNNDDYAERQYDYVFDSIKESLRVSNKGVIFTLNPYVNEDFSYSVVFIFTQLISSYSTVFSKKITDNSYIFTIIK